MNPVSWWQKRYVLTCIGHARLLPMLFGTWLGIALLGCGGGTSPTHAPGTVAIFLQDTPSTVAEDGTIVGQIWVTVKSIELLRHDGVVRVPLFDSVDNPLNIRVDLLRLVSTPIFLGFASIPLGEYSKVIVTVSPGLSSYFIPINTPSVLCSPHSSYVACSLTLNGDSDLATPDDPEYSFFITPSLNIDERTRGNLMIDFAPNIRLDGNTSTYVLWQNLFNSGFTQAMKLFYEEMTLQSLQCSNGFGSARLNTSSIAVLIDRSRFFRADGTVATCSDMSPGQSVRVFGVLTPRHQLIADRIYIPGATPPAGVLGTLNILNATPEYSFQTGANGGALDDENPTLLFDPDSKVFDDRTPSSAGNTASFSDLRANQYVSVSGTPAGAGILTVVTIHILADEDPT